MNGGPALCRWCMQELALLGKGSHYCEKCADALFKEQMGMSRFEYERRSEEETGDDPAERWGAGIFAQEATDYKLPE